MRIRAAVLHEMGLPRPYTRSRPLRIETLDLAPPGPGEVLVRIAAAGLCHSDLSVINGDRPRVTPMALGHEAAGVVEETGPGVDDLQPGDHVIMVFVPSCGACDYCAEGRPALCVPAGKANTAGTLLRGEHRLSLDDQPIHHHMGVSAFADHAVVSRRSLVRVPDTLALEHAALFGCAVLTGAGAVLNTAGVRPGDSVAVIGLGGVGLSAVLGALAAGAAQVIGIDLLDDKLALARRLGATGVFRADDPDCVEQVREASGGGVRYAIEVAGSEQALEMAYGMTARGGVTVTAGLAHPDKHIRIQQVSLVAEERTLKGSYVGSCIPSRDIPRYVGLFMQNRLPVDRILSDTLRLDDINEGFERLAEGRVARQVITFDGA